MQCCCGCRANAATVNERRSPFIQKLPPCAHDPAAYVGRPCPERLVHPLGWDNPEGNSVERIALFHYAVKSQEDWEAKQLRGGGTYNDGGKKEAYRAKINRCAKRAERDGGLCARARACGACCAVDAGTAHGAMRARHCELAARSGTRTRAGLCLRSGGIPDIARAEVLARQTYTLGERSQPRHLRVQGAIARAASSAHSIPISQ